MEKKVIKEKKAQVSIEFIVIIGIALALIIPITIVYVKYSEQGSYEVLLNKVDGMSDELSQAINAVYSYGEGSVTTTFLKIPKGIESITFSNREIVFNIISSGDKTNEIVKVVKADMDPCIIDSPSPGTHKIDIRKTYSEEEGELVTFIFNDEEC